MRVTINKKSTTTEAPPENGQQPKPPGGLNAFYWYQIFPIDSAIVEVQEMFSSHGGHLTNAMYYHGETFSKFYRRYYDLVSKFQVGLKSLLRQGLWELDFYGDLVYKLKKIVGSNIFSAQFIKIIFHYKNISYNINVLQQTACLVANPITVGNFAFLFY